MDIRIGDIIDMKKNHPCSPEAKRFLVVRVGMDFKIRCLACGHEVMLPRSRCEKNIRKVVRPTET